ncbi:hypothetical protein CNR22_03405 [Sphingobacteriaceae bacterium]|nr:hypothetical protein CNR22_03405 [Sphingobacteriaceae bacterium]
MKSLFFRVCFFGFILCCLPGRAQLSYDASAVYGLRKMTPTYSGSAIRVQRTCDNGTGDIGFNSCGDLDTVALKTFVLASNPLSAITVTSSTAFSLRRLRCSYPGNAIRVRSSATGSPTLDIAFTPNGDLDTAALKTFAGTNSAFVTIWYDQSGNARDASQGTTANQPRIVNAGVVERQGGRPAVYFTGMGCTLSTAAFTTFSAAACFNGVARVNTNVTYNTIHNKTNTNYPSPLDLYNAQVVIGDGSNAGYSFAGYGQTFNASLPLSIWTYQAASGGSYTFYYNGSQTATGSVGQYGDNGNPFVLGGRADGLTGLNGWISESITFNSLPTTTDRQFLEWSQSQYYLTGGPALSALPASPASASVAIWYDQSGTGKHAAQATATNQPRIVNAGSIVKNNLNPAINFAGFPQNLVAALSTSAYPVSISLLASTSGSSSNGAFVKLGTDVSTGGQAGIGIGIGNSGGDYDNSGTSVIAVKEWVSWSPSNPNVNYPSTPFSSVLIQQSGGGGTTTYLNGTNIPLSNSSNAVGSAIAGSLLIGGYVNGVNRYAIVKESEVIVFPTALSSTRRLLLEANQSAQNGISIAINKYTPPSSTSYQRFVNGIGRESSTDSVAGTRSTMGMGIRTGTTSTDFLKDNGDYITFGMNCPVTTTVSTSNLPAGITQRWFNDWYVNKTDVSSNNGTLTVFFDFSDYRLSLLPGVAANYELLSRSSPSGNFSIVSGTTKSVLGDRVEFSLDASNITTNFYYTIGTRSINASPLPVELLSFELGCENYKVNCKWSVASEKNNDYFLVERAVDGINFESVGYVKGAGTSNLRKNYFYADERPLNGLAYYRLKQKDFNGAEYIYPLRQVTCEGSGLGILIYPNPNSGTFIVEGAKLFSDIEVIDLTGRVIYTQKNLLTKQEIKIANLKQGVYYVRISNSSQSNVLKMVVTY